VIELVIVVAVIGILASTAVTLYANVQARARIAKAQADVRTLAGAVASYQAHVGSLPSALAVLTATASNVQGQTAGPFMAVIPNPPQGWSTTSGPSSQAVANAAVQANLSTSSGSGYGYVTAATGAFTVSGTGDGVTVRAP